MLPLYGFRVSSFEFRVRTRNAKRETRNSAETAADPSSPGVRVNDLLQFAITPLVALQRFRNERNDFRKPDLIS